MGAVAYGSEMFQVYGGGQALHNISDRNPLVLVDMVTSNEARKCQRMRFFFLRLHVVIMGVVDAHARNEN